MKTMLQRKLRILLADSTDLLLIGARLILEQQVNCQVLAVAADFPSLWVMASHHQPDVIILGEGLAPELDIWEQVRQLKSATSDTRFILMNTRINAMLIQDAFMHGIDGILCKEDDLQTHLYSAVLAVIQDRSYLSPTARTEYLVMLRADRSGDMLNKQARSILQLLAQGHNAGQIASHLQIPLRRVYWVRDKLRRRFGAKTNEHLIQLAVAEGFIYPHD